MELTSLNSGFDQITVNCRMWNITSCSLFSLKYNWNAIHMIIIKLIMKVVINFKVQPQQVDPKNVYPKKLLFFCIGIYDTKCRTFHFFKITLTVAFVFCCSTEVEKEESRLMLCPCQRVMCWAGSWMRLPYLLTGAFRSSNSTIHKVTFCSFHTFIINHSLIIIYSNLDLSCR